MLSFLGLSVWGGQLGEGPPFAGAFSGRGGRALFLVVEPASPGSEEWCGEIAEFIGQSFQEWPLSLTGGVLQALRAVHRDLRGWNRRSLGHQQVGIGVSALAVRGEEAYLAQVGPALAWAWCGGRMQELQPRIPEAAGPLGLCEEFYPSFSRHRLAPGDVFVLLFSSMPALARAQEVRELIPLAPERGMALLAEAARGEQCFGALAISAGRGVGR